jgi:hypothetical protein
MQEDRSGFETKIFLSDIKSIEELTCPICLRICRKPGEIAQKENACGHTGCIDCLREALSAKKSCPICRQAANAEDVKPSL